MLDFPGFNAAINRSLWTEIVQIPDSVYSLDGKRFITTDLASMTVPADECGDREFKLNDKLASFTPMTRKSASYVILEALNGKRKTSTTWRWLGELSLFSRTVSEAMNRQLINTITLKMYLWYTAQKNASQEKLLRGILLRWIEEEAPGIESNLQRHLEMTSPRKPRGMIEVQNAEARERPLSMQQCHTLLTNIDELYLARAFDPQDNLLWKLMVSMAMRPAQMSLLRFRDATIDRDDDGKLIEVRLNVPIVKQSGIPARDYMQQHRLSPALSQAFVDHVAFVESIHGRALPGTWAVFCVCLACDRTTLIARKNGIDIAHLIHSTRVQICDLDDEFEEADLFNRRFKHTKLTHMAAAGAPLDVLAYGGFQTSTVSLVRYVNLTEEAFAGFEAKLEPTYEHIERAFRGKVIARDEATHPDQEHRISDLDMDDEVGACGADPCGVLACLGCYGCPRFEAFLDGPHDRVEAYLVAARNRSIAAGMPVETVSLNDGTLAAVRRVIQIVKDTRA